jgi:hypothetical protein
MAASELFLFVSHVAEDRAPALEIVGELERRGVKCWIAPRDVHPGRPFDDEIVDAIEASRAMLLIFSEHCNGSDYIRREITVAGESHKLIIPFRIEDVPPRRGLRVRLSDLHWIDGFVSRERAVNQVVHTVDPDGVVQQEREHQRQEEEERQAEVALRAEEEERARQAEAAHRAEEAHRQAEAAREAEIKRQRQEEERGKTGRQVEQENPTAADTALADNAALSTASGAPSATVAEASAATAPFRLPKPTARRLFTWVAVAVAIPIALTIMFWQSMPFYAAPSRPASPAPTYFSYDGPGYNCIAVRPEVTRSSTGNNAEVIFENIPTETRRLVKSRLEPDKYHIYEINIDNDMQLLSSFIYDALSTNKVKIIVFCGTKADSFDFFKATYRERIEDIWRKP